jgi:hypothetical protein
VPDENLWQMWFAVAAAEIVVYMVNEEAWIGYLRLAAMHVLMLSHPHVMKKRADNC